MACNGPRAECDPDHVVWAAKPQHCAGDVVEKFNGADELRRQGRISTDLVELQCRDP
ncbi:hypothetical protein ACWAUC_11810 [Bradyrhizobium guangdongense]